MSKTPVKRGRPAGMRARQLELKQTLLEHPDVPKVLEKVVSAALDDEHKNQAVAQKILMDRILPKSTFEQHEVHIRAFSNLGPYLWLGGCHIRSTINFEHRLDMVDGLLRRILAEDLLVKFILKVLCHLIIHRLTLV